MTACCVLNNSIRHNVGVLFVKGYPVLPTTMGTPGEYSALVSFQQARYIEPMLGQCWSDVVDGGPTLTWVSIRSRQTLDI